MFFYLTNRLFISDRKRNDVYFKATKLGAESYTWVGLGKRGWDEISLLIW